MKTWFHWVLRFALGLVALGILFPQASAPEADHHFVTHLVTWHATARGSGHAGQDGQGPAFTARYFTEINGSAMVRFQLDEFAKRLWHYDTHYLSVTVNDNYDRWTKEHPSPGQGECGQHWSLDIPQSSASAYSGLHVPGLYVPPGNVTGKRIATGQLLPFAPQKRPDGVLALQQPFDALASMRFDVHAHNACSGEAWCCSGDWDHTGEDARDLLLTEGLDLRDPKYDLQAVAPNDDAAFAVNTRFTCTPFTSTPPCAFNYLHGGPSFAVDVQWTAEAHRLGKCPCALNSN